MPLIIPNSFIKILNQEMDKQRALDWLNHRRSLAEQGQVLAFSDDDIIFIREYIYLFKKKTVTPQSIIMSLQNRPPEFIIQHLDFIINKLVAKFKIKMKIDPKMVRNPQLNIMLGNNPFDTVKIDFISEYY